MRDVPKTTDALTALRSLTLSDVEKRLADLDAERAALSFMRRSLAARDKARRRLHPPPDLKGGKR